MIPIIQPKILSLITTYRCTASCYNCCFNCSPTYEKMMSLEEMEDYITICKELFPSIEVVVFTGGECTLLKENLFSAINFATQKGLTTRIVSNGYWGRNKAHAKEIIEKLVDNGLSELNISTGKDHSEYVPITSVINAVNAAIENGGFKNIVISVERRDDCPDNGFTHELGLKIHKQNRTRVHIIESPWMNFRERSHNLISKQGSQEKGCRNLFSGIQINPNGQLLSCCGLACEYSPFLKLGKFSKEKLKEQYCSQFNDVLKLWLYMDGPLKIMKSINGSEDLNICKHDCDFCLDLLTKENNIMKLQNITSDEIKTILLRYTIDYKLQHYEKQED